MEWKRLVMEWKSAGASEHLHELLSQKIATNAFRFQGGKEGFPGTTLQIEREEVIECISPRASSFLACVGVRLGCPRALMSALARMKDCFFHPQFHLQIRRSYREVVQASGQ